MSPPILSVRDLRVQFEVPVGRWPRRRWSALRAVDGVSFDLAPGETLGIVGESGCGKSTLGRAVLQLLPVSGGRVVWQGMDLAGLSEHEIRPSRRDRQIIFQDPLASLDPRMTVGQIVAEPLRTHEPQLGRPAIHDRVTAMLEAVGLPGLLINRYPHEFSGGQCQRIGIARAMILRPRLIVCDEPVSALDVSVQAQIIQLLQELQARFGTAYLFISHNLAVVRRLARRIMVLYLGRVMEIGPAAQLCAHPTHPYTSALLSAVPIPDPAVERSRPRLLAGGELPSPLDPPTGCVFRTRCPKARARCAAEAPPLEPNGQGGEVACHFWAEPMPTPAGLE